MKITERDKVLLVLLGVILIVALAIVMPGVGVMACREELSTIQTESEELQKDLDAKLAQINEMGITKYPENVSNATEELKEKIFDLKVEGSHLAGNIAPYSKPYAMDVTWIDGLEYRYGVKSDEGEKLLEFDVIENVSSSGDKENIDFPIDDDQYSLPIQKREIRSFLLGSVDCQYEVEISNKETTYRKVGAFLLFLHNIASKGSMLITEANLGTEDLVAFTIVMPPENSKISLYEQEVAAELEERAKEENGEAE